MTRHKVISVFVLALLITGCGQNSEQDSLAAAQFAGAYVAKLRSADPSLRVERNGGLELRIGGKQEEGYSVFLDNAYKGVSDGPRGSG